MNNLSQNIRVGLFFLLGLGGDPTKLQHMMQIVSHE